MMQKFISYLFSKAGANQEKLFMMSDLPGESLWEKFCVKIHQIKISVAIAALVCNAAGFTPVLYPRLAKCATINSVFIFPTRILPAIGQPPIPLIAPSNLLHPASR